MAEFDHLAIAAATLGEGVEMVEDCLGVALDGGGQHVMMGTHNRLLSLGTGEYLEVIAIDPSLAAPERPRWFDLDRFTGAPKPRAWIARCGDLFETVAQAPAGLGSPMAFERGDLCWQMAVPDTGVLPFDGVYPALIEWNCADHPANRLADKGIKLEGIEISTPDPDSFTSALAAILTDKRVQVSQGEPGLKFVFQTPHGLRTLG